MEGLAELAFRRHHAHIYGYLRRRTGDPRTAEDITQDVFLDATRVLARCEEPPASMLALLYTIAQRRYADEQRRQHRTLEQVPFEEAAALNGSENGHELAEALISAIRRLPESQRQLVTLKLIRGCSFAETADALGVSEAAAKMRLQRALGSLRTDLNQQEITP